MAPRLLLPAAAMLALLAAPAAVQAADPAPIATPPGAAPAPVNTQDHPDAVLLNVRNPLAVQYSAEQLFRTDPGTRQFAWLNAQRNLLAFRAMLPSHLHTLVRYEDLVADPEPVLRRVFAFLGEAWDPAVLRFDEQEHDASDRYRRFTAGRRAAGGESTAIYRSRVGAGARGLDPVLRRLLRASSGSLLRELGYLDGDR